MPTAPTNSILDNIKKLLGISPEDPSFDTDIVININSAFSVLHQLGVGPEDGFEITDRYQTWEDFLGGNKLINNCRTYIYLQVRLWFDPPTTSYDLTAKKEQILELQWRINVAVDKGPTPIEVVIVDEEDIPVVWTLDSE